MRVTGPIPEHLLCKLDEKDRKSLGKAGKTIDEIVEHNQAKSERDLQLDIEGLLRRNGIWFTRQRMDKKTTQRVGVPDFLICMPPEGYFVAWEIKVGNNEPSLEQTNEMNAIRLSGGEAKVIRTIMDAIAELKTWGVLR